ncbi:uncharacterized protein [Malus domestica]|uniref:uncharacterized protein n=1 Tax=Malus domestica TaxID=3750 RepID=UPI0039750535
MSNLNKLNFTVLEVSGRNYLKWVQDVKPRLTPKNLFPTIEKETDNRVSEVEKATAMIFIKRHIHDDLKIVYLVEKDPRALWVTLADRFNHQNDIFLPEQQYRAQNFTKFSNLISILLLAQKKNQLLMKNHQARLTGATVMPEAHYSTNQHPKCQKRHGKGGQKPPRKSQ